MRSVGHSRSVSDSLGENAETQPIRQVSVWHQVQSDCVILARAPCCGILGDRQAAGPQTEGASGI